MDSAWPRHPLAIPSPAHVPPRSHSAALVWGQAVPHPAPQQRLLQCTFPVENAQKNTKQLLSAYVSLLPHPCHGAKVGESLHERWFQWWAAWSVVLSPLFLPSSLFSWGNQQHLKIPWAVPALLKPDAGPRKNKCWSKALSSAWAGELCRCCCCQVKCQLRKAWPRAKHKARSLRQGCQRPVFFWSEDWEWSWGYHLMRVTYVDLGRFWKVVSVKGVIKNWLFLVLSLLNTRPPDPIWFAAQITA